MAQSAVSRLKRRQLLLALISVLALYVLVPQLRAFHASWQLLQHPQPEYVILAIVLTSFTYLAAAATYCFLAFKPLRYWLTVLVQLAAMFINRLLPSGIGALGANYAYLRRQRHSKAQAGSVVAINNILGVLGHSILVIIALIFTATTARHIALAHGNATAILRASVLATLLLGILAIVFGRERFRRGFKAVYEQLLTYRRHPERLGAALVSSMALTVCNVLALYACMLALHVHLSPLAVLLVFSFGIGAATAVPVPGGLGSFEAGLVAGFVAYHVDSSTALAVALLYRLISYWAALAAGAVAFVFVQRWQLFTHDLQDVDGPRQHQTN